MTPAYADAWLSVYRGDCREVLRALPVESVHAVVTSPPYYGLRDYGLPPSVWGGDPDHDHDWGEERRVGGGAGHTTYGTGRVHWQNPVREGDAVEYAAGRAVSQGAFCACGAWRGTLGLEPTPDLYVEHLVDVFREVRRVLRPDGTVWLNLGDTYAAKARGSDRGWDASRISNPGRQQKRQAASLRKTGERHRGKEVGLKEKDLIGVPWMAAFALRDDGWYLRRDIVWSKPNSMPESVVDRPSTAHEYVFLLSRSLRYFYDADAVREPDRGQDHDRVTLRGQASLEPTGGLYPPHAGLRREHNRNGTGRNLRSVWTIPTQPYPDAHFATFPERLVEPCIRAGTSERGVCAECGAPLMRVVEATGGTIGRSWHDHEADLTRGNRVDDQERTHGRNGKTPYQRRTVAWRRTCRHEGHEPVPATVLDPFAGSGTVGVVAQRLSRRAVLVELSEEYVGQLLKRNGHVPFGLAEAVS